MVTEAPIPSDEAARVAALRDYHVLDTAPDEKFDLFTRIATWLYGVPLSAVNFVDADKTFFKSVIGIEPYAPRRCTSICAHAVAAGAPIMVIEDLLKDGRFADHPLATVKGVRFYAGALITSPGRHHLGTLCICDTSPRHLSAEGRGKLIELARGVGTVLELHRHNEMLLRAATRDTLTGLYNRRLFNERLQDALAPTSVPFALLFLDLDRFKQVNDTLGHAAGDAVLCEVARRLTMTVRGSDTLVRLAGDEFVILMPHAAPGAFAEQLAQRVLEAFFAPFELGNSTIQISASIGIAVFPDHGRDAAGLLCCADQALYAAKEAGRGEYRVHLAAAESLL